MLIEDILSQTTPELAGQFALDLRAEDLPELVERLSSREDKIRYPAFLLLRARSGIRDDVFLYWDAFREKLASDSSYQRSIGAMLLAANARWDREGKMALCLGDFLALLEDPKPITVRQAIQALKETLAFQPSLSAASASALIRIDLMGLKDTMRKLILSDIVEALLCARKSTDRSEIDAYLLSALSGDILDEKQKRSCRASLSIFESTGGSDHENRGE